MSKRLFERHGHAPELNKVHFKTRYGWVAVPAPGVSTLQEFRKLHKRPREGRYAAVFTQYPHCHVLGGRTLKGTGYCTSYKAVKIVRDYHVARLTDTGQVIVKIRLIG